MERIEFSLSKGKIFNRSQKVPFWIGLIFGCLFLLICFFIILIDDLTFTDIVAITICSLFVCVGIIFSLYQLIQQVQLKNKISLWIKDAVELSATAIYDKSMNFGILGTLPSIIVSFSYQDKTYRKKSFGGKRRLDRLLQKYINKKIKILYSPTYDEVLILKDDKISLA